MMTSGFRQMDLPTLRSSPEHNRVAIPAAVAKPCHHVCLGVPSHLLALDLQQHILGCKVTSSNVLHSASVRRHDLHHDGELPVVTSPDHSEVEHAIVLGDQGHLLQLLAPVTRLEVGWCPHGREAALWAGVCFPHAQLLGRGGRGLDMPAWGCRSGS